MLFFICVNLRGGKGAGAFSRNFTINSALGRALQTEKLKDLLFHGPVRSGSTNDLCITASPDVV